METRVRHVTLFPLMVGGLNKVLILTSPAQRTSPAGWPANAHGCELTLPRGIQASSILTSVTLEHRDSPRHYLLTVLIRQLPRGPNSVFIEPS